MDRIKTLYQSLARSEAKALKNFLTAFHTKGENKPLELIRLIEKKPEISAEEAAKRLYGDPRSKAFIMMKARLYEKMTEFLPLSVNPASGKGNKEMPYFMDLIEYRKSMLIASVLLQKRLNLLARDHLEKALKHARNCNAPELEADVLIRLRAMSRSASKSFDELTLDLRRAMAEQFQDVNATGIYFKFYENHTLKSANDYKKIEFLENHIPDLENSLVQEYSVRADWYLQMLKVNYYSLTSDYEACKEVLQRAIQLVQENKGLRNRNRMSDPYMQWGILELKFHNYEAAITAFEHALEALKPRTRGHFLICLLKLYGYIFSGDLEGAEELGNTLREQAEAPSIRRYPKTVGLLMYLRSCISYLKGAYHEAWLALQEITELNFDKDGWMTGIRIFEIMILIDREQFDFAGQKLENLRKHLARYESEPRAEVIYKLLAAQERSGFLFNGVKQEAELMRELEEEHTWKHLGHEVIRFEDWYRGK